MLAWVVAMALCLSVTSRSSIETAERIGLLFGMIASLYLSYTMLQWNPCIPQNNGTSCGTLLQTQYFPHFAKAH